MFLIRYSFLEYSLPLPFQLSEQVQNELIKILNCQFSILTQRSSLVLHDILRIHIKLMYLSPAKVISES